MKKARFACKKRCSRRRRILFVVNLRVSCCFLCFSLWKKHDLLAKNGVLALCAMSGVANSLCFYVFSVLQALMERRFTRKNTAFFVDFMFNWFFVVNLRVFCVLAYGKKHESLAKNGVLALWAMSGMANSLCFYMFFSLRSSRETRFTRKKRHFRSSGYRVPGFLRFEDRRLAKHLFLHGFRRRSYGVPGFLLVLKTGG